MNTFGNNFRLTTFGESHGPAVGGVVDGCPAGLRLDFGIIDEALRRRREGDTSMESMAMGSLVTPRKEADEVEWLSGIMDGVTLGTPIAFLVRNKAHRSDDYDSLREMQRPGHADYTYQEKYGIRDHRGGGRSSARETVGRVIAGAIALQAIRQKYPVEMRTLFEVPAMSNPMGSHDDRSTFGGSVVCSISHVPAGWGSPLFGKLNARLAEAMMSIPSAMAFEMGSGCAASRSTGAEHTDAWTIPPHQMEQFPMEDYERHLHQESYAMGRKTLFNHCGGVQGGISNGDPLIFRVHFHPVATVNGVMRCRDANGDIHEVEHEGRHDRCHVLRTPIIVESMAALVLADEMLSTHIF